MYRYIVFQQICFFVSFNKLVKRAVIITNFGMTTAQQLVHMSQFRSISKITKIPSLEKNIQFQHKRLFAVLYYKFTPLSFYIYFSRRGPRCLDARLSQHYTRQEMTLCHFSNFFKFLHNLVSRLDKKSFCTFLCNSMDYNLEKLCSKTSRFIK